MLCSFTVFSLGTIYLKTHSATKECMLSSCASLVCVMIFFICQRMLFFQIKLLSGEKSF